ncbi:hypothetical protein BJ508DRAFT_332514 [Ascobolus immersus RN42]|uniref:Uncharacterized protein n=1 Tax=Ascobolus immersus RN42 TaxID=1160509 RepID=A0A3N4HZA1_ASCIM|nr:hypothetical protein BJ508DRAFT_332514 [Ascobolus immersus RN42]
MRIFTPRTQLSHNFNDNERYVVRAASLILELHKKIQGDDPADEAGIQQRAEEFPELDEELLDKCRLLLSVTTEASERRFLSDQARNLRDNRRFDTGNAITEDWVAELINDVMDEPSPIAAAEASGTRTLPKRAVATSQRLQRCKGQLKGSFPTIRSYAVATPCKRCCHGHVEAWERGLRERGGLCRMIRGVVRCRCNGIRAGRISTVLQRSGAPTVG